jgi:electron transport complex protein RnfC
MPTPGCLLISLGQHIGAPSRPLVKKGDAVAAGQAIAEATGYVSSRVHSPVSGVVKSIDDGLTISGRAAAIVEITPDQAGRTDTSLAPIPDWEHATGRTLVERVTAAGIIGMGGAGFPTHVKATPPPDKKIHTLIINGAECEPFLTADHRLMLEDSARIWEGARILRHILGADTVRVAIEDNKPDAVAAMEKAMAGAQGDVELVVLKTEYPQGAEKQLIYSVMGREVPLGGLPMDVGALVENVATAAAIRDAIVAGTPLTRRIVTVTGPGVKEPKNVLAILGTPIRDLIQFCGGLTASEGKVICGGPMMGITQPSLDCGIGKTTSGLLVVPQADVHTYTAMTCISCGRCVAACPMHLLPCTLSECAEAEDYAGTESYDVMACIECGCCAYECPAARPLVQHMKQSKSKVTLLRREREAHKRDKEKKDK